MKDTVKKKEIIVLTAVFALWLFFNGILLAGHELWRDEANVWLLARELSPLQLLREIKYQGHPCLWYFIVMPFAKLGLPFKTLSVISFLIMSVSAGIFVYRAPFCCITKAVCLISPVFSYYYPVVARNYCLIALLMILLAVFHPKRNDRPVIYGILLGLLVQSDTIVLAAAGLISLMWLAESIVKSIKEKSGSVILQAVKGLWIPLASLLLWILQFYQVSDSPEYHPQILSFTDMMHEIRNFSYSILTRMTGQGQFFDLLLILLFMAAGILISLSIKNFWPMIVMAGAFLFEVIFSIMIYQLHIWHYIAICFVLIWFFWVGSRKEGGLALCGRILSEGLLILLSVTMFMRWNSPEESSSLENALKGLYSDGENAAAYIEENIPGKELILSTDVAEASTVAAYLGRSYVFYYAGNLKPTSYADYSNEQSSTVSYEELLQKIRREFPDKKCFYILICPDNCIKDIPDEVKESWEICYQTQEETARGENYKLCRVELDSVHK
ncbi:MAG: hypothetical protein J6C64_05425 [Lachnospiraceae bacterium]|nr:hypothetical protein [Lachnospiraceae bacterium]